MSELVANCALQNKQRGNPEYRKRGEFLRDKIRREILADIRAGDPLPKAIEIAAALGVSDWLGRYHRSIVLRQDGWIVQPYEHNKSRLMVVERSNP